MASFNNVLNTTTVETLKTHSFRNYKISNSKTNFTPVFHKAKWYFCHIIFVTCVFNITLLVMCKWHFVPLNKWYYVQLAILPFTWFNLIFTFFSCKTNSTLQFLTWKLKLKLWLQFYIFHDKAINLTSNILLETRKFKFLLQYCFWIEPGNFYFRKHTKTICEVLSSSCTQPLDVSDPVHFLKLHLIVCNHLLSTTVRTS